MTITSTGLWTKDWRHGMELSENARQVLGYIPYGGDKAVTVRVIA